MPKSRVVFWRGKLEANAERDRRQLVDLEAAKWIVLTVWECETRDAAMVAAFVEDVANRVRRARLAA